MNVKEVIDNLQTFVNTVEIRNGVLWLCTSITASVSYLLENLFLNEVLMVLMGLCLLDTVLKSIYHIKLGDFNLKIRLQKIGIKLIEYSFYTATCFLLAKAPTVFIAVPLVSLLHTYMIARESASVMKISAVVFDNQHMLSISNMITDAGDRIHRGGFLNHEDPRTRTSDPEPCLDDSRSPESPSR